MCVFWFCFATWRKTAIINSEPLSIFLFCDKNVLGPTFAISRVGEKKMGVTENGLYSVVR